MKYIIALILFFGIFYNNQSLAFKKYIPVDSVYNDSVPYFEGGDSMLSKFIGDKLDYRYIRESGIIMAYVQANFVITKEGKVKNLKINTVKGYNVDINKQMYKILSLMPDWIPGTNQNGDFNYQLYIRIDAFKSDQNSVVVFPWYYYLLIKNANLITEKFNQYYDEGVKLSNEGNWEAALFNFNEALKLQPDDIFTLFNRGISRYRLNDKNGACDDWYKIKSLKSTEANELIKKFCSN